MQLQGIRIQYFINGGIALAWIYLTLHVCSSIFGIHIFNFNKESFIVLVPAVYIIGMMISYCVKKVPLIYRRKKVIQGEIYSKHFPNKRLSEIEITIRAALLNKEVYDVLEIKLTRQLIARGNLLNISILAVVVPTYLFFVENSTSLSIISIGLFFTLLFINWRMWLKHQESFYEYQCEIAKQIWSPTQNLPKRKS